MFGRAIIAPTMFRRAHSSWEKRRRERIRLTRLMLAIAVALVPVVVIAVLPLLFAILAALGLSDKNTQTAAAEAAKKLVDWLTGLPTVGDPIKGVIKGVEWVVGDRPAVAVFVATAAISWARAKNLAERLHDRAFAEFDSDTLTPIRRPRPFDPLRGAAGLEKSDIPMPWLEPVDGPRKAAWDALHEFAWAGTVSVERHRWFGRPETPFGWTLVMGRPGSGKSRLAVEFARALANRKAFGGDRPEHGWLAHLSVRWRVDVLLSRLRHDDPWDAGWLRPERLQPGLIPDDDAYPEWRARGKVETWLLDRLEKWRPRRPTILLLDDPRPGDAKAVITSLTRRRD